jgi:hypothetical protein
MRALRSITPQKRGQGRQNVPEQRHGIPFLVLIKYVNLYLVSDIARQKTNNKIAEKASWFAGALSIIMLIGKTAKQASA